MNQGMNYKLQISCHQKYTVAEISNISAKGNFNFNYNFFFK